MKYDFNRVIDRSKTNSLKWDISEDELPMWVADMDFQTAPEITEEIIERAKHGVFGYSTLPDEWYDAYINWWDRRHNFKIEKEWLIFCSGVIPAISSIVRRLTCTGENVLIQTPVYNNFFNSILNNGRNVLEVPLKYDGEDYSVDFDDLELKLSSPQTTMMILCNPQNPSGKVWDKEILKQIGRLCARHNVVVISDEIHCDITEPGHDYTSFASVNEECRLNSVTCVAPTKTFNIAGLQTAGVIVPNISLRSRVSRGLNNDEVAEPNVFAVVSAIAAFNKGEAWLDELRQYITQNKEFTINFLRKEIPKIRPMQSEAAYLLWLNCREISDNSQELTKFIREKTGLYLSEGSQYGKNGEGFIRMNVACPRGMLHDGVERLKTAISLWQ